jgi:lauroyl/myristoyl acyltransferase
MVPEIWSPAIMSSGKYTDITPSAMVKVAVCTPFPVVRDAVTGLGAAAAATETTQHSANRDNERRSAIKPRMGEEERKFMAGEPAAVVAAAKRSP